MHKIISLQIQLQIVYQIQIQFTNCNYLKYIDIFVSKLSKYWKGCY